MQPVILIGMHRSGTSMLTRLLESLGLFVGHQKQAEHEALFFLELNQWLMSQCGGAWDHPEPIADLLEHDDARALVRDYLEYSLRSARALSFLGPRNILYRTPANLPKPWGWKDPRTTFTLPLWLDLFPEAKVVHVYRHPVDVADSLYRRQASFLKQRAARYRKLRPTYFVRAKQVGFTDGLRCASLDEGLALWEAYAHRGRELTQTCGDRGFEIKYEELLENPSEHLPEIGRFCGLDVTQAQCDALTQDIRADRAYSYRRNPERVAFAESVKNRLASFGY